MRSTKSEEDHQVILQMGLFVVAPLAGRHLRQVPPLWLQKELGSYHMVVSGRGRSAVYAGQPPDICAFAQRSKDILSTETGI
jgi:hypothetical protein